MPDDTDLPIAYCVLKPIRSESGRVTGHVWHVPLCPFCSRRHTHGAGRMGIDDPRDMLGTRIADCRPVSRGQYRLVEQPAIGGAYCHEYILTEKS